MTVAEKIRAYLAENNLSQAHFCRLSLIPESNLSLILREETEKPISLTMVQRAARFMGVTIDDLVNDELGWPLPKRGERPRPMTEPEKAVVRIAHDVSRNDAKPAQLATAINRLLALDSPGQTPLQPVPPPSEGDGGGKRRR